MEYQRNTAMVQLISQDPLAIQTEFKNIDRTKSIATYSTLFDRNINLPFQTTTLIHTIHKYPRTHQLKPSTLKNYYHSSKITIRSISSDFSIPHDNQKHTTVRPKTNGVPYNMNTSVVTDITIPINTVANPELSTKTF